MFFGVGFLTVCIRIVADCGLHPYQVTRKLKRATTLEITTEPAIVFIYCCMPFFIYSYYVGYAHYNRMKENCRAHELFYNLSSTSWQKSSKLLL